MSYDLDPAVRLLCYWCALPCQLLSVKQQIREPQGAQRARRWSPRAESCKVMESSVFSSCKRTLMPSVTLVSTYAGSMASENRDSYALSRLVLVLVECEAKVLNS